MAGKSGKKKNESEAARWERRFEALQAEVDALRAGAPVPSHRYEALDAMRAASAAAALGSPARIALANAVREAGATTPAEAGRRTGIATGALYHHVAQLLGGGILAKSPDGTLSLLPLGERLLGALGEPGTN